MPNQRFRRSDNRKKSNSQGRPERGPSGGRPSRPGSGQSRPQGPGHSRSQGSGRPGENRNRSRSRNESSGRPQHHRNGRPNPNPGQRHRSGGPRRAPQQNEAERSFFQKTVIDPFPRIRFENGSQEMTMRVMDMLCPVGMGQRGLIVSPPGSGKTTFLKHICQAVAKGYPDIKMYCMLIDERPEEVTDFRRNVTAEVRWSSTDQSYDNHLKTAHELMQQVYREADAGENVMVVIDSLTRLARVHNAEQRGNGRTLSGGVDARAMEVPRRIFGSARKIENGGSLTILATILIDTGSRMDQVIFEEFKGTGNMEIVLSREISSHRIYPAVKIRASSTRKEERLFDEDECASVHKMRSVLAGMGDVEAARGLIEQLAKYPTNREFLDFIAKTGA